MAGESDTLQNGVVLLGGSWHDASGKRDSQDGSWHDASGNRDSQ